MWVVVANLQGKDIYVVRTTEKMAIPGAGRYLECVSKFQEFIFWLKLCFCSEIERWYI